MTDTGSFKYPSTTFKTHEIISKLINHGANGSEIHEKIYNEFSLNKLNLLSICLNNIIKVQKLPVIYMTLNQKELDKCYFKKGDTEGFVNYGLSVKGIKLSIILIENKHEKIIKMSFRSKGNFPVNLFAEKYLLHADEINTRNKIILNLPLDEKDITLSINKAIDNLREKSTNS